MNALDNVPDDVPLEALVEQIRINPGAPFQPNVLKLLAALKQKDRVAFEALRKKLKGVGCRVMALDEALKEKRGGSRDRPKQADILVELAQAADLFHAPDGSAYADLDVNGRSAERASAAG
jgi:hypothetical protein